MSRNWKTWFWTIAVITIAWMVGLWSQGRPLGKIARGGIVTIEGAPGLEASRKDDVLARMRFVEPWLSSCSEGKNLLASSPSPSAPEYVLAARACGLGGMLADQVLLDFPFIILYVLLFALGSVFVSRWVFRSSRWWRLAAAAGSAIALFAGVMDWRENTLLLALIQAGDAQALAAWTPRPCQLKWAAIGVVVALLLLGVLYGLWRWRSEHRGEGQKQAASGGGDGRYPEALEALEAGWVVARRTGIWTGPLSKAWREEHDYPGRPLVGIGLSGGGIRSATFCLGVFQALARVGLVRKLDFLSTVSGGGYFGSFFGTLFSRDGVAGSGDAEDVLKGTNTNLPDALKNLRENGRYLAPNGSGDLFLAGATLVRNWVALQLVVFTLVVTLFVALQMLSYATGLATSYLPAALLHGGGAWHWSPWVVVALATFVLLALPAGWAYWMVGRQGGIHPVVGLLAAIGAGVLFWLNAFPYWSALKAPRFGGGVVGIAVLTFIFWGLAHFFSRNGDSDQRLELERNWLSIALKWSLIASGVIAVVGVVDSLARTLYAAPGVHGNWLGGGFAAVIAGASAAAQKLSVFVQSRKGNGDKRLSVPMSVLAGALAILLGLALAVLADWLALGILWSFHAAPDSALSGAGGVERLWLPLFGLVFASWLFAHTYGFLNRSSQHALYSARLTRAYLGASNPARKPGRSISRVLRGDDPGTAAYWSVRASERGAPLHLINTTINETVSGRSQVEQRDRKGVGMALGPFGIHVGKKHHLLLDWSRPAELPEAHEENAGWKVFRGDHRSLERLPVGQWVGISGAAISTGVGSHTSLGLSFLAGFANVRLGYWWRPDNPPSPELGAIARYLGAVLPVQWSMLSEFFARFPGTADRLWYLSDGGHSENMGGYELIRRRLRRVVIVDAEADPEYKLGGLANLVRRARVDFGAEIRFWDKARLNREGVPQGMRPPLGTLDDIRAKYPSKRAACAALADIIYDENEKEHGRLLYVKAKLCGQVPVDVGSYHDQHSKFPQETTADQFFDEAQWESYRKLGQYIGANLFGELEPGPQTPPAAAQEFLRKLVFE